MKVCNNKSAGDKQMSIKLIQQEKGFTIVEIMIALLILAGGLMATAYMQTRSVSDGTTANRLTRRTTGAEEKIEDLHIRDIEYNENYDPFYKYNAVGLPITGDPFWDNDTSPYYKIRFQSLGGVPLINLTTIEVTLTPKGEKSEAAIARRTLVLNYVRSSTYQ
jgi:prepilin-type N-terminal cleavage/methylation domain-containing protein